MFNQDTVKLLNFKPNRIESNKSSLRRNALELLDYFCLFVVKISIRLNRSNRTDQLNKIHHNQFILKFDRIELIRFSSVQSSSVRFEIRLKFGSFNLNLFKKSLTI